MRGTKTRATLGNVFWSSSLDPWEEEWTATEVNDDVDDFNDINLTDDFSYFNDVNNNDFNDWNKNDVDDFNDVNKNDRG